MSDTDDIGVVRAGLRRACYGRESEPQKALARIEADLKRLREKADEPCGCATDAAMSDYPTGGE